MRLLIACLLAACGTRPPVAPEAPVPEAPPAPAPASEPLTPPPDPPPDHPTVVFHGTHHWVIGLPASHGWKRNDWVALSSPPDDRGTSRPLGVALVLTTEAGRADAAPLALVGTVDKADLIGTRARVIHTTEGEWPHVGKLLATVLEGRPAPTRVRLNIGKNDGVFQGDRYSLRRLEDNNVVPRSQVEVVEVGPTWSVAAIEDGDVVAGQALVFEPGRPALTGRKVRILVCNFQPMSGAAQSLGETFAAEFRQRLQNATRDMKRVEVVDEVATVIGDGEAGHEEARRLGRSRDADLVVWGTARCHEGRGCTYPRFTLVDPEALRRADWRADQPEFALFAEQQVAEKVVRTPEVLAAALLGFLSYKAQHYQDARQYLERALGVSVLVGIDQYRALQDLSKSLFNLGLLALAQDVAAELETVSDTAWKNVGRVLRAGFLHHLGRSDESLALLQQAMDDYEALGLRRDRALALLLLAQIHWHHSRVDEALALYRESLQDLEAIGDRRARAEALTGIATVLVFKGRPDEALDLYQEARQELEDLGDQQGEAIVAGLIAGIYIERDDLEPALKLLHRTGNVLKQLGDRGSSAVVLGLQAHAKVKQGDLRKALELLEEEKGEYEALGHHLFRARAVSDMAEIVVQLNDVGRGLTWHQEALEVFERLGSEVDRATSLNRIGRIRSNIGELEEALALHREALAIFEARGAQTDKAITLAYIGYLLVQKGDSPSAVPLFEEQLRISETTSEGSGIVSALTGLGLCLGKLGRFEESRAKFARAWEMARQLRQPYWIGETGSFYGVTLMRLNSPEEAVAVLEEAIPALRQLGMVQRLEMAEQALAAARAAVAR